MDLVSKHVLWDFGPFFLLVGSTDLVMNRSLLVLGPEASVVDRRSNMMG